MTDTAATLASNVTVSDAGPSRKRLTIEVPADAVSDKLAESFEAIRLESALPGFRKGKAPMQLIEKRFGGAIRNEARKQLLAQAYSQAVEEHKLKVLGDPIAAEGFDMDKVDIAQGRPAVFEIEVEVMPEFILPSIDGIAVKKPIIEITDEIVDGEVEKICINEGRLEPLDAPKKGDYLTGHAVMTDSDGTEHYNIQGAVVRVPRDEDKNKGMILGVMVDDLGKQLGTPKPGETATITTTGPTNHEVEALRDKALTITFVVERADRIVPAELDQLVGAYGMESPAQLKEAVKARLTQRGVVQQRSAMHQQVSAYLIDNTKLDLPERLTAQQAGRMLARRRAELLHRGVDQQAIEEHMAELRAGSDRTAARETALFFILARIADEQQIRVEESEINGRIAQLAAQQGVRPERMRQEIIQRNQVGVIAQQVRDHKAMDFILERATIEEMNVDDYNAFVKQMHTEN